MQNSQLKVKASAVLKKHLNLPHITTYQQLSETNSSNGAQLP